jgi:hypothetical protein
MISKFLYSTLSVSLITTTFFYGYSRYVSKKNNNILLPFKGKQIKDIPWKNSPYIPENEEDKNIVKDKDTECIAFIKGEVVYLNFKDYDGKMIRMKYNHSDPEYEFLRAISHNMVSKESHIIAGVLAIAKNAYFRFD